MSAKINLLPDVRQAKLQDKQRRQLALSVAVGSVVVTAALLVFALILITGQKLLIKNLTDSISKKKGQVASYPDVKTILSAQARLDKLPGLYDQRVVMTKLVSILSSAEPQDVSFSGMSITNDKLTLTANGKSYLAAAKIARSLETAKDPSGMNYFTDVTLSAVSLSGHITSYSLTATINPGATSGK